MNNLFFKIVRALAKEETIYKTFNSAVIAAGGSGTRAALPDGLTKQLAEVDGTPVVVRSVMQFEECDFIDEIIIVAKKDELPFYSDLKEKYGFKKISKIVPGGNTRQESVMHGIEALSPKSDFVAIHDAARCLVTPENIKNVFLDAIKYGAACAANKTKDTIKLANEDGFISETVDRSLVWHAQTPQIFKTSLYIAASAIAQRDGIAVTDDCMIAEHAGFKVKLTDCGYENIKITTTDDFAFAQMIIDKRKGKK